MHATSTDSTLQRATPGAKRYKKARPNPWTPVAIQRRETVQRRLGRALDSRGNTGRAVDVRMCGACRVAVDAAGDLVVSAKTQIPSAVVFECGHRLCPNCAPKHARRHAKRIAARLSAATEPGSDDGPTRGRARFVTLTQPARPGESAKEALERLEHAIKRLMRLKAWKAHAVGGVLKFELEFSTFPDRVRSAERDADRADRLRGELREHKRKGRSRIAARVERTIADLEASARLKRGGSRASWWHAHAHVLVVGCYWRHADLLATWRAAMTSTGAYEAEEARIRRGELAAFGGARIEAPRSHDDHGIAREVAKYVSKPLARHVPHDRMVELLEALGGRHKKLSAFREWKAALESAQRKELKQAAPRTGGGGGRRMLRPFGTFWGMKLDEDRGPEESTEGCDDEIEGDRAAEVPIGVSSGTGAEVFRSAVRWVDDWASLETRRAMRELIHDAHEHRAGRGPPI